VFVSKKVTRLAHFLCVRILFPMLRCSGFLSTFTYIKLFSFPFFTPSSSLLFFDLCFVFWAYEEYSYLLNRIYFLYHICLLFYPTMCLCYSFFVAGHGRVIILCIDGEIMLIKEKKIKATTILTREATAVILKSKVFAIFGWIKKYQSI